MANKDKSKKSVALQSPATLSSFEQMERWFDEFLPSHFMQPFSSNWPAWPDLEAQTNGRFPKVDVIDKDADIIIRAELPGVKKEDLDISLKDDLLTIKASTKNEKEEEEGEYHRREISRSEFQRTMKMPVAVVSDKVKSSFNDGILELTIPKEKPAKRKKIKVE